MKSTGLLGGARAGDALTVRAQGENVESWAGMDICDLVF